MAGVCTMIDDDMPMVMKEKYIDEYDRPVKFHGKFNNNKIKFAY